MKALIVTQYNAPGQLAVTGVRRPVPGPCQLLLQVEAAGVNPADYKPVTGEHRDVWPLQFPFVPGLDVAGTVAGLGDGADGFAVGDKVFGMLFPALGSFAEYALASAGSRLLARRPGGLDPVRAAALATVGWRFRSPASAGGRRSTSARRGSRPARPGSQVTAGQRRNGRRSQIPASELSGYVVAAVPGIDPGRVWQSAEDLVR